MSMDLSEFRDIFFEEAEELLAEMERLLLELNVEAPKADDLNAIFRAAHSIKGGAATFGMPEITEVTHVLENLLDRLRKFELAVTAEHVEVFLQSKDVLRGMIETRRNGREGDGAVGAPIIATLQRLAVGQAASSPPAQTLAPPVKAVEPVAAITTAEPAVSAAGADAEAARLAAESAARERALIDKSLADNSFGLFDPVVPATPEPAAAARAAADPKAAEPVTPAAAATAKTTDAPAPRRDAGGSKDAPRSNESSTIRVGVEKVDALINLVGELVITHAMIEQLASALDGGKHQRLVNSITQLARNTRELQESVLGIRMLPMDVVFSRFPRMVRDLAAKLGKKVELITQGATTELDKSLTERLVDPLTHLVRNSLDHGFEMPDARRASGKSEVGKLTLSAAHQGGSIVIEVSDDGAGLNRDRILAKAKQQGLAVHDGMSDEEVWPLIFAPGFSTAEVVTDVSGRGVGMDVVKQNITAMGGHVEIRSARGFGSSIRISLPLTLAILDGMSVKVGDEVYVVGLSSVIESVQPGEGAVKRIVGQGDVLKVREEYLPILPLHQSFGVNARHQNPADAIIVILESEGRKVGLMVDELVGQQQVVVKSLETNYRRITGISGATILGDGSVALILDVPSLVRRTRDPSVSAIAAVAAMA